MKLTQVLEARYGGKQTPIYYFEYYPHHMGTLFRYFETSIEDVDSFTRDVSEDDDVWDDIDERVGDSYAIGDVIQSWAEVREKIQNDGQWVDMWEEGSHAISTKSLKHAMEILKKYEKEVVANNTDAYDDEFGHTYDEAMDEFPEL
jgi:hypothetical protein